MYSLSLPVNLVLPFTQLLFIQLRHIHKSCPLGYLMKGLFLVLGGRETSTPTNSMAFARTSQNDLAIMMQLVCFYYVFATFTTVGYGISANHFLVLLARWRDSIFTTHSQIICTQSSRFAVGFYPSSYRCPPQNVHVQNNLRFSCLVMK